jgi:hypothetical protein
MTSQTTTDTVPPPLPSPKPGSTAGASIAAIALAALLLDLAVETLLAGSPVLWAVMAVEVVAVALLALLWTRLGPTLRLAVPLAALLGLVVWAILRLGSWSDPALRIATLGLPRIGTALAILATLAAVTLVFGLAFVRRAWYVGAVVGLLGVYALVPLVRGAIAGTPLVQVLAGALDWPSLPAWLQGGFVATQVLLPLGMLAGLAAVGASFSRKTRATWATAGLLIVVAAFVVQSSELTRGGRSHLAAALVAPALAKVSVVALPDPGTLAAGTTPVSLPTPGTATPGSTPPGDAAVAAPVAASGPPAPPPPGAVGVAQAGQPITNKAIELRVTGHRTAASLGGEAAGPGREFVVVDMAWKNILEKVKVNRKKASDRTAGAGNLGFGGGSSAQDKADDEANTTLESMKFEVSPLPKHLWLIADGRFAEAVDVGGTSAVEGHLGPNAISIANSQQTVTGGVAFKAPAGAQALSLLFLDSNNGHLLVPIKGAPPVLAGSLGSGSRANEFVDLALTGAAWSSASTSEPGTRAFVLGLRGISRQNAIVDVPFEEFGFLQTDQGCLVQPDAKAQGLTRQLAPTGRFLPFVPSEGQLAFPVPAGSNPIAFLLRLQQGGPIDMPLKAGAKPQWPAPEATITDGDVLRVLKLPGTTVPPGIPPAPSGSERVAIDLVVENMRSNAGIDIQAQQQLRLVTPDGQRHEPAADSAKAPCSLGSAVVPAGASRRFTMVYDVPPGQALQFEYRGFNVKSELIKVR